MHLFLIGGCASPTNPAAIAPTTNPDKPNTNSLYVTLAVDDTAAEFEVVQWLRFGGVRVDKTPDGDDRIFDNPACRSILTKYRRMLHTRMNVIAENVACANVTHDAGGAKVPYRRKFVVADSSGSIEIRTDPSPLMLRYEPGNPDADAKGYVHYPNVDLSIENVNTIQTAKLYRMVTRILTQFDLTFLDAYDDDMIAAEPLVFSSPLSLPPNEMVPVVDQSLSGDQIRQIDSVLEEKRITHSVTAGNTLVPADRRIEIVADLMYAHQLPRSNSSAFLAMSEVPNAFSSSSESNAAYNEAKQQMLANIIQRFPDVKEARVIINRKESVQIETATPPTAAIFITTDGTVSQPKSLVAPAATTVANAVSLLKLENVSVKIDGVSYRVIDPPGH